MMMLQKFYYNCNNCKTTYTEGEVPELLYGLFLLRSNTGKVTYLLALDSKEFAEISTMVRSNHQLRQMNENERSDVIQPIFGITCDPASDGSSYQITQKPVCPKCKQADFGSWGPVNPREFVEEDIEHVTHQIWNNLGEEEKKKRVDEAISTYLIEAKANYKPTPKGFWWKNSPE